MRFTPAVGSCGASSFSTAHANSARNAFKRVLADGPAVRVVAVDRVREAFVARYEPDSAPGKRDEASRKAFSRGMREALQAGAVTETRNDAGHWLMRSGKA